MLHYLKIVIALIGLLPLIINTVYAGLVGTDLQNLYVIVRPDNASVKSVHLQFDDKDGLIVKYGKESARVKNITQLKVLSSIQRRVNENCQLLAIPYVFLHPIEKPKYEFKVIFIALIASRT